MDGRGEVDTHSLNFSRCVGMVITACEILVLEFAVFETHFMVWHVSTEGTH